MNGMINEVERFLQKLDKLRTWKGWKFSPIIKFLNPKNDPYYFPKVRRGDVEKELRLEIDKLKDRNKQLEETLAFCKRQCDLLESELSSVQRILS